MSHLSILLLLVGIFAHQAWGLNIATMCRGHLSGTLLPNPQDCGSYYVCQSGPQLLLCSDGLHFDRVHKVCNWPDVANCKLEDIESVISTEEELEGVQQEKLSEEEEKTSEKHLADSKEMEHQYAEGEINEEQPSHQEPVAEQENLALVSSVENQLDLSKPADNVQQVIELQVESESSSQFSQASEELSSSKVNEPQPEDILEKQDTSKQNENSVQTLEVHMPVSPIKLPNPFVNEPQAEIAVEQEDSLKQTENSFQTLEVHIPVSPIKLPNPVVNEPQAEIVVEEEDSLKQTGNSVQTLEVHIPVSPIKLPNPVVNEPQAEIVVEEEDSSKQIEGATEELHNPVSSIELPNSIVNEAEAEIDTGNEGSLKPSPDSHQVIEVHVPVSPIELHSPIVNEPEAEYIADKVDSLKPQANVNQVIEVHVPVSPIELPNSIVNEPETEIDVDNKDSLIPSTDSKHVIKVNVPVSPIELPNSIVNEPEAEYVGDKVNSIKPSGNVNQLIEVHVPVSTIELPNSIGNKPQVGVVAEKVNTLKESDTANVIEVLVPVSPIELPNSFANAPDYLVEKVDASSHLDSTNQIIQLYVPPQESNTIVNGNDAITGAVVEKVVETAISPENTNKIISLQVPVLPVDNLISIVNDPDRIIFYPEVEKVESSKPSKNGNQVIDLHAPIAIHHWQGNGEISHAIVEKVESKKPGVNQNNVIELLVSHSGKVDREDYNSPNRYPIDISGSMEFTQLSGENGDSSNESTSISLEEDAEPLLKEDQASEEDVVQSVQQNTNDSESSEDEPILPEDQDSVEEQVDQQNVDDIDSPSVEVESALPEDEDEGMLEKAQSSEVAESLEEQLVQENAEKTDSQSVEVESALPEEDENELEKVQSSGEDNSQPSENEPVLPKLEVSSKDQQNGEKIDSISTDLEEEQNANQSSDQSTENKHDSTEVNDSSKDKPNVNKGDSQSSEDEQPEKESVLTFSSDEDSLEVSSEEHSNIKKPSSTQNKDKVDIPPKSNPVKDLTAPIGNNTELKPTGQHSSLLVSLLSYATAQGNISTNGTLNRPIIGATDIKTGHPTDVMTGYNSNNVQCIHKGLYFLPHPRDCQKYFICAYSNLHMHTCGNNLIWNYKREQCEFKRDTRCYSSEMMVLKPKRKPTKAPSPTSTAKPARKDNVDKELSVPKATPTPMPPLRTTFLPTMAVPVSSVGRAPTCPPLKQVYLPSFDDCNKYFICILGHPALTSCPGSLHWDTVSQKCAEPAKARCAGK